MQSTIPTCFFALNGIRDGYSGWINCMTLLDHRSNHQATVLNVWACALQPVAHLYPGSLTPVEGHL